LKCQLLSKTAVLTVGRSRIECPAVESNHTLLLFRETLITTRAFGANDGLGLPAAVTTIQLSMNSISYLVPGAGLEPT